MGQTDGWIPWADSRLVQRVRSELISQESRPIAWAIQESLPKSLAYAEACRRCPLVRSFRGRKRCQERFLQGLAQARTSGHAVQFICPIQRYTVVLPVQRDGKVQGYLASCHHEHLSSRPVLRMAEAALEAVVKEVERGEELKTLSETIQPRCVALSTVHTIHRLISSTLKLEELLPRVARLCCQVLRAQSCVIWLVERDKKRLVPRAEVRVEKKKERKRVARPCKMGEGLIGKTAQALKSRFSSREMAVPLVEEECLGVLSVARVGRQESFKLLDQEIITTLAEQAVVAIRNAQMYETQERVTWGTIRSLSAMLEGMDAYTPGKPSSGQRLASISLAIAEEMKVPALQQQCLQYAALLHDAGRVGIPEQILRKPSKLDAAEYEKIKEHPVKGASFLEPMEILEPAIPIILSHHERYDGTGYPKGLKKESIPLGARILGLANAVEAMISDRPYRRAMSLAEVAKEISSHTGTQFDPKVVEAFLRLVRRGKMEKLLIGSSGPGVSS